MLDRILNSLDASDMTRIFVVLSIVAALLLVYVMNLTSFEHEDRSDPAWLQWLRRGGYVVKSIALLWSLSFMQGHSWQPWPPSILLIVGIILGSLVRITAIHLRIRREGSRRGGLWSSNAGRLQGSVDAATRNRRFF